MQTNVNRFLKEHLGRQNTILRKFLMTGRTNHFCSILSKPELKLTVYYSYNNRQKHTSEKTCNLDKKINEE